MRFKHLFLSIALISLLSIATGCGSGGGGGESSDGSSSGSSGGSGTLSLLLQDAFSESYKAVYVTIKEVQICMGTNPNNDCDWQGVASPGRTYNLLELVNGVREQLGLAALEAGSYTQMRLIIGRDDDGGNNLLDQTHPFANYVILNTPTNDIHELKIPSGYQTGIKIVHGFVIEENKTTELILDFDASKSVVRAGASGQWLLKPTIKVLASQSIVSGTVEGREAAASTGSPLQGALVSAQQTSNDNPEMIASTTSDEDGNYALFISPGTYNIVGSKTGYEPACFPITTGAGIKYLGMNLVLIGPTETGAVTGKVFISESIPDQSVTLSFRREVSCGSGNAVAEIKFINLASGDTYREELTPGVYTVHASTANHPPQYAEVTVVAGEDKVLDDFVL